ncbi:MAG: crosslink repair DNA glycosylase YcaQ family protein [Chloroflexota bacterium]|nr:winged helix DNA-binding domain-containing protein [Dehalococcoidia bacterium]MDW8254698.1 crosslink repair DNA glycosylase YcaQ family protein [Chloroflexota bacterium]
MRHAPSRSHGRLGWLLAVYGPLALASSTRRRADLDDATLERGIALLRRALANGPLSRSALLARLAADGLALDPTSDAPVVLLVAAAHRGVIALAPGAGRTPTVILLDDWATVERAPRREAALGELARRYLRAFGPARAEDFAARSRLPSHDVRAGWEAIGGGIVEVTADGRPAWLLDRPDVEEGPPVVRLLPAFDTDLLGYRERSIAAEHAGKVKAAA